MDYNLEDYIKSPKIIFYNTYYNITNLFNDNYYLLILFNFFVFSLTNILIYQKVFKKYFSKLSNIKLLLLFYLLFLDPYRLHLASHILKETCLIFIMILMITSKMHIFKISCIWLLEIFRPNAWIYSLIFFTVHNIKNFFTVRISNNIFSNISKKMIFSAIFILIIFIYFFSKDLAIFIKTEFKQLTQLMLKYYNKEMPLRSYDNVAQFKDYGFPLGFILKNLTWPLLLISGLFGIFVTSVLFKFLGIILIINNIFVYFITRNTFISLGLLIVILMIHLYI